MNDGRIDFAALPPVSRGSSFAAEWLLAWAHLRSPVRERFLSIATLLCVLGVTLSVASLNWVLAVMAGFEVDMRDKILGANAHVVIFRVGGAIPEPDAVAERVRAVEGVVDAAPFAWGELMIRSPARHTGVVLKGVDLKHTPNVTQLRNDLVRGVAGDLGDAASREAVWATLSDTFVSPSDATSSPLPGIVLGELLAKDLMVAPGDVVQLINPMGGPPGPMGMPTPTVAVMRVAALFRSGMYEYDSKWTYATNDVANEFLRTPGTASAVEVRLRDPDAAEAMTRAIEATLGYPYMPQNWKQLNQKLFHALALEKVVIGLVMNTMTLISGLLIVCTLWMLVLTKRREIAVLKAIGATTGSVLRVFLLEGMVIGLVGATLGTALGLGGCLWLDWYEFPLDVDVYYLASLPVVVEPGSVLGIAVSAAVVAFLCTLIPAASAARLEPVDGLRFE